MGGVDTHKDTHHAAVVSLIGEVLGSKQFEATMAGYQQLLAWMRGFGPVARVGVEGTGSYGVGVAGYLAEQKVKVVEVNRPDRAARRRHGKSDPIDAVAAAMAALNGSANAVPKAHTGPVEAIRVLRVAREGAVKARTAAMNQLKALIVTAPDALRAELRGLPRAALVRRCADLLVDESRLNDPLHAAMVSLQTVAQRIHYFDAEINKADKRLKPLVTTTAPTLCAIRGVGPEVAGQLLVSAGDNPDRLRSEAAFAHLCGVAPIPASSGKTGRNRLNRAGDRHANSALYTMVITRLAHDPRARDYKDRRTAQGKSTKDIIRCLKRYAAREVHAALQADLATLNAT
jgi:transposase